MKSKIIFIDASKKEVVVHDYNNDSDELQKFLGGWIEIAYTWSNGDVLFVDEEGMLKFKDGFFRIAERPGQPLAGNGVIVGKELYDADGEYRGTASPMQTVQEVLSKVRFGSLIANMPRKEEE